MNIKEQSPILCTVHAQEVARVKGLGCLRDKNTPDRFNCRVITGVGKLTAEQLRIVAQAAERFGTGEVAMTTRLTVEIQGVPFDRIHELRAFLNDNGLDLGGTGPRVRPVVSCKGTTCIYGLIDTYGLARKIHEQFYLGWHEVKLPHKFKIAVGGCPNNCVKPDLNDLGIVGQRLIKRDLEKCRGCKKCRIQEHCPIGIAQVQDGKLLWEGCNNCGRCLGKCPFGVTDEYVNGYKVCIGGRWGKKTARGKALELIFENEGQVLRVVEQALILFRDQGLPGERFADTVERLGFEAVQSQLLK